MSLLAAAALVLPSAPPDLSMRILREAPVSVFRAQPLAVWVELFVNPDGRILDCQVLFAYGDERAAKQLCVTVKGEQATPGTGPDGTAVHGVFRTFLRVTGGQPAPTVASVNQRPEMQLQVASLPAGVSDPLAVAANVLVDAGGAIVSCEPALDSRPAFAKVACERAGEIVMPIREARGVAVPYLTSILVEFTVG